VCGARIGVRGARRARTNARAARAASTRTTRGTVVPASDTDPHEVQSPAACEPTRIADEQNGQAQVSVVMMVGLSQEVVKTSDRGNDASRRAGAALPREHDGVLLECEAPRKQPSKAPGTAFEVVDAVAAPAVEVVVMVGGDLGELVAGRLAGNRHGVDLAGVFECAKVAIDGALADRRNRAQSEIVQLVRGERARLARDDRKKRTALARGAAECLLRGRWCLLRGRWCLLRGRWCLLRGRWCLLRGRWRPLRGSPCVRGSTRAGFAGSGHGA
jgi:hypothetical protein